MQTTQKENKKKQTQLPQPGAAPEVLNPQVISPHHIEREFLLKKIDSLRYTTREQKRTIARLKEKLQLATDTLKYKIDELDLANCIVEQQHQLTITHQRLYKDLHDAWLGSSRNCKRLKQINDYLLKGVELKPAVKKIIEAKKLPLHFN